MARLTTSRRRLTQYYIVGGNAVSAFLSWRLQATNSCDVTLVWKSGFEHVSQYGVSFKSKQFGNERFKPRHVVRTPEEGIVPDQPYDYVILCVKALPDVYDLASVIEAVVTPRHTCILVNTSNTVGVESHLESRFPANVILSLVSHIELAQIGVSEFEHLGSSQMWIGPAISSNNLIPNDIKMEMASALAITLGTGQVDCQVSSNIRQQQYERMMGPIAFHPVSVVFECPSHAELIDKVGVRQLICGILDELLMLATAQGCSFSDDFKDTIIEQMVEASSAEKPSTMYQDFLARRPMEIEMYLGSPIKFAQEENIQIPRIETVYTYIHHINTCNQQNKPLRFTPSAAQVNPSQGPTQLPPQPQQMPMPQQQMPTQPRPHTINGGPPGPGGPHRRGQPRPPYPGPQPNGLPPRASTRGPRPVQTDPDDPNLEEFSHLVLYDDMDTGAVPPAAASQAELALRERELAIRQRELKLRERELALRRGKQSSRATRRYDDFDEDEGEDDDFTMPDHNRPMPHVDPDSIDMLSVTSRRNRRGPMPGKGQLRRNPEAMADRPPSAFSKYFPTNNRRKQASDRIVEQMPTLHDSLLENPMMTYASNRYATVDRSELQESRTNSMTSNVMAPASMSRRPSNHSPGSAAMMSPGVPPPLPRGMSGRASLSQQDLYNGAPGPSPMPRPPPGMMRGPSGPGIPHNGSSYSLAGTNSGPQHPPTDHPHHPHPANGMPMMPVPPHAGMNNQIPSKHHLASPSPPYPPNVRSLTGSASASAGSGDSGSGNLDFNENSAASSQISLGGPAAHHAAAAQTAAASRT